MLDDENTVRLPGSGDTIGDAVLFDRFTLCEPLGSGAFGEVWRATDRLLERDVALRVLPESVVRDTGAMERLKRTIDLSLEITHPAFVRLYDLVEVDGAAAVSMELVTGENLAVATLRRPGRVWSVVDLAPILARICEALDHAHLRRGLVHGRLTSQRIYVDHDGAPKILGWFESSWRDPALRSLSATQVRSDPEGAAGGGATVATDIHALGAIVYELLAGGPPHWRGNLALQRSLGLLSSMASRRHERAEELEPAGPGRAAASEPVPDNWETAVAACLATNPADRPSSAGVFFDCIRGLTVRPSPGASGTTTVALDAAASFGTARTTVAVAARRRVFVVWWLAAAAAMLVFGAIVWRVWPLMAALAAAVSHKPEHRAAVAVCPKPGAGWTIPDLGMRFAPVDGLPVLISIWEVRVKDFEAFVAATRHDATVEVYSYQGREFGQWGDTWESPGFPQTSEHPVVGLQQGDAQLFCRWLTERERAAGRLAPGQSYRLPTDDEWEVAGGDDSFEWGSQWPPPPEAGNFADRATAGPPFAWGRERWIDGYEDGVAATAPVGRFRPNRFGLFDLSGNAAEYIEGRQHGYRGGSFESANRSDLLVRSPAARGQTSKVRSCCIGFRVVCVVGNAPRGPALRAGGHADE